MSPTQLHRAAFALVAAVAVAGCGDSPASPGSRGVPEVLQQPTFVGASSGVAKSASYRVSFVMGAQTPHRKGEQYIVGNAQGGGQ